MRNCELKCVCFFATVAICWQFCALNAWGFWSGPAKRTVSHWWSLISTCRPICDILSSPSLCHCGRWSRNLYETFETVQSLLQLLHKLVAIWTTYRWQQSYIHHDSCWILYTLLITDRTNPPSFVITTPLNMHILKKISTEKTVRLSYTIVTDYTSNVIQLWQTIQVTLYNFDRLYK